MSAKDQYSDKTTSDKQNGSENSVENHSVKRREVLKAMGKIAYVAPSLSIISLSKGAQADIPPSGPPHPLKPDPRGR